MTSEEVRGPLHNSWTSVAIRPFRELDGLGPLQIGIEMLVEHRDHRRIEDHDGTSSFNVSEPASKSTGPTLATSPSTVITLVSKAVGWYSQTRTPASSKVW